MSDYRCFKEGNYAYVIRRNPSPSENGLTDYEVAMNNMLDKIKQLEKENEKLKTGQVNALKRAIKRLTECDNFSSGGVLLTDMFLQEFEKEVAEDERIN